MDAIPTMYQAESAWLEEYRRGRVDSLGRLVEQYRRPLFAFILRMTEGHGDAEEIYQDVWLRVIRNIASYRQGSFLSWLFRIAHNLVIDRARKRQPQTDLDRSHDETGDPFETRVPDPGPTPLGNIADKDLGLRIRAAVRRLPPEQRAVFLMRTEADLPFKEIARIQETSISTALARMQYALSKLRSELKSDYESLGKG